jgi:hypothetical protein
MNTFTQPAYPVMPLQDNFQRLVVPVAGLSKVELFALEIFKCTLVNNADGTDDVLELMNHSIETAVTFLKKLDVKSKKLNDEKDNELSIFNH